jgi:hypothetical protein
MNALLPDRLHRRFRVLLDVFGGRQPFRILRNVSAVFLQECISHARGGKCEKNLRQVYEGCDARTQLTDEDGSRAAQADGSRLT